MTTSVLGEPVPEGLVRTIAKNGEQAARWLAALPALVDELLERWSLTPEFPLRPDRQCSLVVNVSRDDGQRCVLKVEWPHPEMEHEGDALRFYAGVGAARLLEEDRDNAVLLIERCEPGTSAWQAEDVLDVCATLMRRLWRPVPDGHPFDDHSLPIDRPRAIRRRFVEHGRPIDAELCESGAALFESLSASAPRGVLLHGDFHPHNVLRAQREPWLAIDPKPLVGDPAFDCAQLVLNLYGAWGPRPERERDMPSTIVDLAHAVGVDPYRVWGWTFARTVEEITWTLADGLPIDRDVAMATYFASLRP